MIKLNFNPNKNTQSQLKILMCDVYNWYILARSVSEFKNAIRLSEKKRITRKTRYLESSTFNGYSIQS